MMSLIEFSKAIKEIINDKLIKEGKLLVNTLPEGESFMKIAFEVRGNNLKIKAKTSDLQTVLDILSKVNPPQDYDYILNIMRDGKIEKIELKGHPTTKLEELKQQVTFGSKLEIIYYEKIITDGFEIMHSDYSGIDIKIKEGDSFEYFKALVGLFPYADISRENNYVEYEFRFALRNYKGSKKEIEKELELTCFISVDGKAIGARKGHVFF